MRKSCPQRKQRINPPYMMFMPGRVPSDTAQHERTPAPQTSAHHAQRALSLWRAAVAEGDAIDDKFEESENRTLSNLTAEE